MYESRPPADIGVEYLWSRLAPLLWYLGDAERAMVREGLELAVAAHDGQRRKSGEPFVTHPVEVGAPRCLQQLQLACSSGLPAAAVCSRRLPVRLKTSNSSRGACKPPNATLPNPAPLLLTRS